MTISTKTSIEEKPYHHGDLRRALLDAALQVIAERGVGGLTLREVARQAGVSHNAPYHHFADKAALVAALVEQGFIQFGQSLHYAAEQVTGNALDTIVALGTAYVQFAIDHPQQFRLMFRPELWEVDPCDDPENKESFHSSASFDMLIRTLTVAQEQGLVAAGNVDHLALTAWSTVHGLATLILDGNRDIVTSTEEALELARASICVLIQGLAKRD